MDLRENIVVIIALDTFVLYHLMQGINEVSCILNFSNLKFNVLCMYNKHFCGKLNY